MEQDAPLIELRGVVKRYDDKVVLDGIDLRIRRGETCVLIGGSGSGKSTLARLLIALERPSAGHILVGGEDLTELSDTELARARRRFAMVFQKYALLDSLTVFDNVAFPLREETRLREREVRERVLLALRELDVEDAAAKLPGELSGGDGQARGHRARRGHGAGEPRLRRAHLGARSGRLTRGRRADRAHARATLRDLPRHHPRHGHRLRGVGSRRAPRAR